MTSTSLFELEPHGPDTFVGIGPRYPWGGLFGGQIVAQSLRAAAATVDPAQQVHSLRAYFIRRGDHTEPIRFEVDRIRNGRSFSTRRVVARQAIGAILNLESSFQAPEPAEDVTTVGFDRALPGPEQGTPDNWSDTFERRDLEPGVGTAGLRTGAGRHVAWMRVTAPVDPDDQLVHRCWLAYMSDDMPAGAVRQAHPALMEEGERFVASLDHTIWFHRPLRADEWHLYDFSCHGYTGGRGLAIGHVFSAEGAHVATVAQEVLFRDARERKDDTR